ncbi:PTS lactose/cellobiose transporter subunit IIA [Pelolinea submarina]|uniref:PTS system cellobiose-specific IIA component n=1 Tax=Pelolinea submarina TaxID=913107 RepID=A0A347ZQN1_9CHLR|nr:PTS lactose/cellobiose transporter subunit IIA [Pelolinea submarina]REG11832.1 PTS system cellobiose-specific IIA component [Pelolinea submarina]BBB47612.1 PTS system, cellobiose-specific IIA component [Pelolinea submarina]
MNEELIKTSMEIIIKAGDAHLLNHKALKALAENDFELAANQFEAASKKLVEAHKVHTTMIQSEASGNHIEYSVLFTHAQDTLMTINSEIGLSKSLFKVFESLNHRIEKLEEGMKNCDETN